MNKPRSLAPGSELRDYITDIAEYIKSAGIAFETTQRILSSGDMQKIKLAVDEMKGKLLNVDKVKRKRAEIITKFDIGH